MARGTRSAPLPSKSDGGISGEGGGGSLRRSPSDSSGRPWERLPGRESGYYTGRRQSAPSVQASVEAVNLVASSQRSSSWSGHRRRSSPQSGLERVATVAKAGSREFPLLGDGVDSEPSSSFAMRGRRHPRPGLARLSTPETVQLSMPVSVVCDPSLEFFCDGLPGRRSHMEDRTLVVPRLAGADAGAMFGVFDGHGSGQVADLAVDLLPGIFADVLTRIRDPYTALRETFLRLDQELLRLSHSPTPNGFERVGSTANVVLIIRRAGRLRFFCANTGDSRAVLSRGGVAVDLSRDHKPQDVNERRRIEAAGGYVTIQETVARVDGRLAVSRALGDFMYKDRADLPPDRQKVIAVPDIKEVPVGKWDDFVVVGSDGVFGVLTSEELISRLGTSRRRGLSWERAIRAVLEYCSTYAAPEGGDNCSLCVAQLVH